MKNKQRFCEIILSVADNFSSQVTDRTLKLWWEMFQEDDVTVEQIAIAAKHILRTRKYTSMPTYADFIEHIQGKPEDQAEIQASHVLDCLRQYGRSQIPDFEDPVTKHLMTRRWPWHSWAGNLLEKEIPWWAKEFKEAYLAFDRNKLNQGLIGHDTQKNVLKLIKKIG